MPPPQLQPVKVRTSFQSETFVVKSPRTPRGSVTTHRILPINVVAKAQQVFDMFDPVPGHGLKVTSAQQCLNAMGIMLSENQVKDKIFELKQSTVVEEKNQEIDRMRTSEGKSFSKKAGGNTSPRANFNVGAGATSGPTQAAGRRQSAVTIDQQSTASSGAPQVIDHGLYLSFALFLELITMTLDDCDRDREVEAFWKLADADKDGQLGMKDIHHIFSKFGRMGEGATISHQELELLMRDLDFDSDGVVSLEDLKKALNTG